MKKIVFLVLFLVVSVSYFCSISFAIDASATMPYPTGITPVATLVMGKGTLTTDWKGTATTLNFDPLTLFTFPDPNDAANPFQIFLPDHFFSIDVGYVYTISGAPITKIVISYKDTSTNILGPKATATFVKKKFKVAETIPGDLVLGGKVLLSKINTLPQLNISDLGGGWLRAYIGLANMDSTVDPSVRDPADAKPFVPGDAPGPYTGQITISAL